MSVCCMTISLVLLILVNGFVSGINGAVVNCASVECKETYLKINQDQRIGSREVNGFIANTCPVDITDVRVDCGSFIEAGVIPPNIFKPVRANECLVNNGNPIGSDIIKFRYSNPKLLSLNVPSHLLQSPKSRLSPSSKLIVAALDVVVVGGTEEREKSDAVEAPEGRSFSVAVELLACHRQDSPPLLFGSAV
ncbi:hypothetical protein PIB30_000131 [Stylosanthes scabra]|uniref:Uncharacterized protein n=1 Tax=Stylosanthes scabra TaxID=79078 RepID=A0ABU6R1A3_9FABA|nr:hypothetical protein [Stylosanthes scabra]